MSKQIGQYVIKQQISKGIYFKTFFGYNMQNNQPVVVNQGNLQQLKSFPNALQML